MPLLTDQEHDDLLAAARERDRLLAMINTPELVNFREAVLLEALHQRRITVIVPAPRKDGG